MILTINASPVANGTTEGFCETFEKCIKGKCRFERINLRDFNIPPSNGLYKIPTIEVRKIGERVLRSRGVFIATPTYWYNVPATLRAFIEQLTPIEEKLQKRSRLLAVATYSPEGGELGCFTAIVAPLNMLGLRRKFRGWLRNWLGN